MAIGTATVSGQPDNWPSLGQQLHGFNQRFYASAPDMYFKQRLANLWTAAANLEEWGPRLRAGIVTEFSTLSVGEGERMDSELNDEQLRQYVTADTEVLHHQIAETVVRLFFAHAGGSRCPWIDVSDEWHIRRFREKVQRHILKPRPEDLTEACRRAFLGDWPEPPEGLTELFSREQWDDATLNLAKFLQHFAAQYMEEAGLYNAAKHGMAVNASTGRFRILDEDGNGFGHEGPSLSYLERTQDAPDTNSYQVVQRFVGLLSTWLVCSDGVRMMHNLWHWGRARHLGVTEHFEWFVPVAHTPVTIQRESGMFIEAQVKLDAVQVQTRSSQGRPSPTA